MIDLFQPGVAPFGAALMIMALIALLEVAGLLFGVAFSSLVDSALPDFDFDAEFDAEFDAPDAEVAAPNFFAECLSWLSVGKVPLLILLAGFLGSFGLAGIFVQSAASNIFGFILPVMLAVVIALAAALPATRYIGKGLARIMPKEQTDAVSTDSFIGRSARIIRGVAKQGTPAEAKLTDAHGKSHYVLIEPDKEEATFTEGAQVLIVERAGAVYKAIENANPALAE